MTYPIPTIAYFALLLVSVSCSSTHRLPDATSVPLSPFIEHHDQVQRMPPRSPFDYIWSHQSPKLSAAQESNRTIYVAPVKVEAPTGGSGRPVAEIARHAQSAFPQAFLDSPSPRYRIVEEPGDDSVILELSIVELGPNRPEDDGGKKGLAHFGNPLAGLAGKFTEGGIAIEGKLRDGETGQLLFQFADRESDKITDLSFDGFRPDSHANSAIDGWAEQFEEISRSPKWRETLKNASLWTLNPLP